ncbi:MAG: hypothetical protein ACOY40_03390 [Bacillota bacterium]
MVSFSASGERWICPYCHEDISKQPDYNIYETAYQSGEMGTGEIRPLALNLPHRQN